MSKKIPKQLQTVLNETRKELKRIYHKRLKEIILFGSCARGDWQEGSDIDVVLLLENLTDFFAEREKYIPIVSQISLKYDTVVSIVPFDFKEFQKKRTPLILNVNKEGIPV
jgi:predicted nucleotidyltransferase